MLESCACARRARPGGRLAGPDARGGQPAHGREAARPGGPVPRQGAARRGRRGGALRAALRRRAGQLAGPVRPRTRVPCLTARRRRAAARGTLVDGTHTACVQGHDDVAPCRCRAAGGTTCSACRTWCPRAPRWHARTSSSAAWVCTTSLSRTPVCPSWASSRAPTCPPPTPTAWLTGVPARLPVQAVKGGNVSVAWLGKGPSGGVCDVYGWGLAFVGTWACGTRACSASIHTLAVVFLLAPDVPQACHGGAAAAAGAAGAP
jgi:hypothetical protein